MRTVRKVQKVSSEAIYFGIRIQNSILKLICLPNYRLDFVHQGVNPRIRTCGEDFNIKDIYCFPQRTSATYRRFQNELVALIHHQIHIFFRKYRLISSSSQWRDL